eukprot:Nitzschia sp. Nitz4//scaffold672_size1832//1145//1294//NITZ4_009311-RA/size1832-exonerate_est2genome-gene-0.0-mRNA-1//-1//CDS//3329556418//1311//frame0
MHPSSRMRFDPRSNDCSDVITRRTPAKATAPSFPKALYDRSNDCNDVNPR